MGKPVGDQSSRNRKGGLVWEKLNLLKIGAPAQHVQEGSPIYIYQIDAHHFIEWHASRQMRWPVAVWLLPRLTDWALEVPPHPFDDFGLDSRVSQCPAKGLIVGVSEISVNAEQLTS